MILQYFAFFYQTKTWLYVNRIISDSTHIFEMPLFSVKAYACSKINDFLCMQ